MNKGSFSVLKFYQKRSRRILPALFLIILVAIPFAWICLTPAAMLNFSKSLMAVVTISTNFIFWKESGYFDSASELKPLLHTWSLAVEEQYYLIFPILLKFLFELKYKSAIFFILIGLVCGFVAYYWMSIYAQSASFYLLPARAWQFMFGVMAAYLIGCRSLIYNRPKREALSLIGAGLIFYGITTYGKTKNITPIESLGTTFGAFLIIVFAVKDTIIGSILRMKFLVGVGLVSYSAYLWHQPIFAFSRLAQLEYHTWWLILITFAFAYLTWFFVEIPFRNEVLIGRTTFIRTVALFSMLFFACGLAGVLSGGYKSSMINYKFSDDDRARLEMIQSATNYDMIAGIEIQKCHTWADDSKKLNHELISNCFAKYGKAIIVLGDSHAMNLYNIISMTGSYNFIIGISRPGCRPHDENMNCQYSEFETFAKLHHSKIKTIVYHQSGSYYIKDRFGNVDSQLAFNDEWSLHEKNIELTKSYLAKLNSSTNLPIHWVGPFREYRKEPSLAIWANDVDMINSRSDVIFDYLDEKISQIVNNSTIRYSSFSGVFFEPRRAIIDGCFVFRDLDHYSKCGEQAIARRTNLSL